MPINKNQERHQEEYFVFINAETLLILIYIKKALFSEIKAHFHIKFWEFQITCKNKKKNLKHFFQIQQVKNVFLPGWAPCSSPVYHLPFKQGSWRIPRKKNIQKWGYIRVGNSQPLSLPLCWSSHYSHTPENEGKTGTAEQHTGFIKQMQNTKGTKLTRFARWQTGFLSSLWDHEYGESISLPDTSPTPPKNYTDETKSSLF